MIRLNQARVQDFLFKARDFRNKTFFGFRNKTFPKKEQKFEQSAIFFNKLGKNTPKNGQKISLLEQSFSNQNKTFYVHTIVIKFGTKYS